MFLVKPSCLTERLLRPVLLHVYFSTATVSVRDISRFTVRVQMLIGAPTFPVFTNQFLHLVTMLTGLALFNETLVAKRYMLRLNLLQYQLAMVISLVEVNQAIL